MWETSIKRKLGENAESLWNSKKRKQQKYLWYVILQEEETQLGVWKPNRKEQRLLVCGLEFCSRVY